MNIEVTAAGTAETNSPDMSQDDKSEVPSSISVSLQS
jgi:hypothetical protein